MAPKLSMIQKIKTIAYSSDRNSIYLKMTKWERILEIIPSSLFLQKNRVTFQGHRAEQ